VTNNDRVKLYQCGQVVDSEAMMLLRLLVVGRTLHLPKVVRPSSQAAQTTLSTEYSYHPSFRSSYAPIALVSDHPHIDAKYNHGHHQSILLTGSTGIAWLV
jgi:hypothetical protein